MERIRHQRRDRHHYFDRAVLRYQMGSENGIKEAYRAITGEKTNEDLQNEKSWKNLDRVQKINKSARAPGKGQRTKTT